MTARIITYGATVTELLVADRHGQFADVVLGFDNLHQYETESPYFGCTVGRVAFRTTNAEFTLDGRTYHLTRNAGPHHLHGGMRGLSHVVWQAEPTLGYGLASRQISSSQPGWRSRLPRQPRRVRCLHADGPARTADRLHGHHRSGDTCESHAPQLLQPGGCRGGRCPRPPAAARGRSLHAHGRRPDPHGRHCSRFRTRLSIFARRPPSVRGFEQPADMI